MPISKTSPYDVAIVGAGINGCCCAYFLRQAGFKVALIDQTGIAAGGSGAAGAFIAPKISKKGALKLLMEEAYLEALDFYTRTFPQHTLSKPLIHIAKSPEEGAKIDGFRQSTRLSYATSSAEQKSYLTPEAAESESIVFENGAVIDAQAMCRALAEGTDLFVSKIENPNYENGLWNLGDISAKHLLLTIGAYPKVLPLPYISLRGIWGHRIDVKTSTAIPTIVHHHVSISPTAQDGTVAIGATHDVHFSPFDPSQSYDVEAGRKELLEKALKTVPLKNVSVVKDYTGLRSGSNDYMPMIGSLVDTDETFSLYPHLQHGKRVDPDDFIYYPHLTMINGSGGYGFVLAPYLAKRFCGYLSEGKNPDAALSPSRFFLRWVKRLQS